MLNLSLSPVARRLPVAAASLAAAVMLFAGLIASDASAAPIKAIAPLPPAQSQVQEVRTIAVPRHCAIEVGSRRNPSLVYTERCLRDSGLRARLPQHCARMLPTRGHRPERAYEARCMADRGFVMARPSRHQSPRFDAPRPFPPRY